MLAPKKPTAKWKRMLRKKKKETWTVMRKKREIKTKKHAKMWPYLVNS